MGFSAGFASLATLVGSTIVAGVIVGAVVGAVVGGLIAAFNGGSIGKGMLYGGIGGAVLGGVGGSFVSAPATGALAAGGSVPTYGMGAALLPETIAGQAAGGSAAYAAGTATAVTSGLSSGALFGGAFAGPLVTAAGSLFSEEPYGQSKEYLDNKLQTEKELTEMQINKPKEFGPDHALELQANDIAARREELDKQINSAHELVGLNKDASLEMTEQEYALAKQNKAAEFQLGVDKGLNAADAAGSSEYVSGREATARRRALAGA